MPPLGRKLWSEIQKINLRSRVKIFHFPNVEQFLWWIEFWSGWKIDTIVAQLCISGFRALQFHPKPTADFQISYTFLIEISKPDPFQGSVIWKSGMKAKITEPYLEFVWIIAKQQYSPLYNRNSRCSETKFFSEFWIIHSWVALSFLPLKKSSRSSDSSKSPTLPSSILTNLQSCFNQIYFSLYIFLWSWIFIRYRKIIRINFWINRISRIWTEANRLLRDNCQNSMKVALCIFLTWLKVSFETYFEK